MSTSKEELAFVLFMVSRQTEKGRNTPASLYIYNKDLVSYVEIHPLHSTYTIRT